MTETKLLIKGMEALLPQAIEGKLFLLAPSQASFSIFFLFISVEKRWEEDKVFFFIYVDKWGQKGQRIKTSKFYILINFFKNF